MNIEKGKTYRHFKGHIVKVLEIGTNTETMEEMVVYEHLGDNKIWIRPYDMFASQEDISSRKDNITGQKTRFELYEL